jgi:hypothetical protein
MYRVAVLLPERFRGGCSFGADTHVPVSSNDGGSLSHRAAAVKRVNVVMPRKYMPRKWVKSPKTVLVMLDGELSLVTPA